MCDLDDEELKATRKLNGADTKIVLYYEGVVEKLEELEKWLKVKTPEDEQYYFIKGKIACLQAILKGDISVL